jgi:nicotinamidase-related amidase
VGADAPQATGGLTDVARRWLAGVERAGWSEVEAAPERTGVVVVDMLMGFARIGPLASPRVDALTAPIAAFLAGLWGRGVRAAWRLEDAHTPDAGEFAVYPPHCLEGSPEAEPLPELMAEPLFAGATRVAKNALTV